MKRPPVRQLGAAISSAQLQDVVITRRRGRKLENAILDAAWDVLTVHGYHGFTYEVVALAYQAGGTIPPLATAQRSPSCCRDSILAPLPNRAP